MSPRRAYGKVFLLLVATLMVLPFLLAFNDTLTRLVSSFKLYALLQEVVVPLEVKIVGLIVRSFGVDYIPTPTGMVANGIRIRMSWNCLGWQSLVLFVLSMIVGLRGSSFTACSRIEAVFLGLFGIFWINIFRVSFTVILAANLMSAFKLVFHDYLAAIVAILYLFFFWWFAYTFILEERRRPEPVS